MILIKRKMPKSCSECNCLSEFFDYPTCILTDSSREYKFNIFEKRMPDCPLIKIPDCHGDLIDRDELLKEYPVPDDFLDPNKVLFHITGIRAAITCADTVIPGDKEET